MGTGSCPDVGEKAARENEGDIRNFLRGSRIVFVTTSLGGGTGTGSAPFVAGVSRKMGALTVGFATMPFSSEGKYCAGIARGGLVRLRRACDATFVVPNDRLVEQYPTMPIHGAFMQADTVLTTAINGVVKMSAMPGQKRIDHSDIMALLDESGVVFQGTGASRGPKGRPRSRGFIVHHLPHN
jgi:cell division protein FtsZ